MSEDDTVGDNAFTGKIRKVTIEIGPIGAPAKAVAAAEAELSRKKALAD